MENLVLKRNGSKPLYLQVKDILSKKIENGDYPVDEKLPSERELCEIFNVSRITIRQAIEEAIKEGLLYKKHGKGTFVAGNVGKFSQSLEQVVTFQDLLKSKGVNGRTEILSSEVIFSDMETSSLLNVKVGTALLNLKLIAYLEETPVAFYDSLILEQEVKNMLDIAIDLSKSNKPFTSIDLYQKYEGIKPNLIQQSIQATTAKGELSRVLEVEVDQHLMEVTSLFLIEEGNPIEFRKAFYLGDNYIFYITRPLNI